MLLFGGLTCESKLEVITVDFLQLQLQPLFVMVYCPKIVPGSKARCDIICQLALNKDRSHFFHNFSQVRQHQSHCQMEKFKVFCHCRQPYTEDVFMAQCDCCQEWFHRGCQRIPRKINKNTPFICKKCK